ncbi:hypothetical protein Q4I32_002821 [Leishmania shawi]|uniref:Uncharacterized protein n=1 Tax=Leishmania shawi TaxID=5680 RepID=A0AAW3C1E5_9TRYP
MRISSTLNRGAGGRIHIGAFPHGGLFVTPVATAAATIRASGAVALPSSESCVKRHPKGEVLAQPRTFPKDDNNGTACGEEGTFCSWSIQSALQAAYPPLPLVTAFYGHRVRLLPPRYFYQRDLLSVSDHGCTTSPAAARGGSATVSVGSARITDWDSEGDGSGAALLLLYDVATLPWAAGAGLTLTLRNAVLSAHDEMARQETLAASGIKGNGGEHSRPSSASPVTARVGSGAAEHRRTLSIATMKFSPAQSEAEGEDKKNAATSSSTATDAGDHTDRTVWQLFSEYRKPQACAEASALALCSFAVVKLGQRVPLVALVAEKACSAGTTFSSLTEPCVTHRASGMYDQQRSNTPAWLPPRTAVHRMPVEVYAERTPLMQTAGTAALQRALRQALNRVLPASPRPSPLPLFGRLRWCISPLAHLIWNGRCWVEETDVQVAEMEERLLGALMGGCDVHAVVATADAVRSAASRNTTMCGTPAMRSDTCDSGAAGRLAALRTDLNAQGSSHPRFWLPSCWYHAGSSRGVLTPLFREHDDGNAGIGTLCGLPGATAAPAASWCGPSSSPHVVWRRTNHCTQVGDEAVEAAAAAARAPVALAGGARKPPAIPCSQWLLRLRKVWLLSSPSVKSAMLARAGTEMRAGISTPPSIGDTDVKPVLPLLDAARGARDHSRAPSSSLHAPVPVRYPNYDLFTGSPLDLRDYDVAARGFRVSSRSPPTSRSTKLFLCPSRTAQPPPAQDCGVKVMQGATPQSESDPFFFAALSQQVGWIRLSPTCSPPRLHVGASSASAPMAAPGMGPVSWQLPNALHSCYTMPDSLADAPQRQLCSGTTPAAQAAAPRTTVASSRATAPHLPSVPQPPVASVSVPQQEWWTGFFLHDAPHWWRREVLQSEQQRWAAKRICKGKHAASVGRGHERDAERIGTTEEVARILLFLQEECRVPLPPINASDSAAAAACPSQDTPGSTSEPSPPVEVTQKRTTLPPQVYVLRLAPVAPVLRRPHRLVRRDEQGVQRHRWAPTDALGLELQWFLVPDTATATVNTFFSLQDVSDHVEASGTATGASPPTSLADRAVLFYLEVKAALELLRRITHRATAWEGPFDDEKGPLAPPSSPPAWWEQLSNFYDANTFLSEEAAPPTTVSTTDKGNKTSGGDDSGGEIETTHSDADAKENAVPAFCHPTVAAVVRTCVRLMLQCGGPAHHRHVSDFPITLDSGGSEDSTASSEAIAVWSRTDYDALLRTALITPAEAAVMPSLTPRLRSAAADGDGDESGGNAETDEEGAEEAAPDREDHCVTRAEHDSESSRGEFAVKQETQRRCTASCGAAASTRDHGTSIRYVSSSAQGVQRSSSTLSCLPYGVEVYEYDESGTRHETRVSHGGPTLSLNDTQALANAPEDCSDTHLCPLHDRSAVDRRLLLGRNYRLSEASQPRKTPGDTGAVTAVCPASSIATCVTSSGKPLQARQLSVACVLSISAACKEAMRKGGDVGAHDGPPARCQLNSAELLVQNEKSVCSGGFQGCADGASLRPSNADGVSPTLSSASPSPPLDVIGALIAEEKDQFNTQWRPWLRYLPRPTMQDNTLPTSAQPTGPQMHMSRVFPFLKSSAASEYCIDSPLRAEATSDQDGGGEQHIENSALPGAAAQSDGAVAVLDLGLCVLHVRRTDVYVNAANLVYKATGTKEQYH